MLRANQKKEEEMTQRNVNLIRSSSCTIVERATLRTWHSMYIVQCVHSMDASARQLSSHTV